MSRRSSAAAGAAFGAALLLTATAAALARDSKPLTEEQKIESLLTAVAELKDAKFVRNGVEYDAQAAADHLRRKWNAAKKEIKTARDFIRLAATKSDSSGKPYLVRFKDGTEVESGKLLAEKLEEIEKVSDAAAHE